MKVVRKIIEINEEKCEGCGLCLLECHRGALLVENGKAVLISDKLCDGLGSCLDCCPRGALKLVSRAAEPFNIKAYLAYEEERGGREAGDYGLDSDTDYENPAYFSAAPEEREFKGQWPLKLDQIASIPDGADILLCADCAAAKTLDFCKNYAQRHYLITVCPRSEEAGVLATRLAALLAHVNPRSLTSMRLETDCCRSMPLIGAGAANIGGFRARPRDIVIGLDGRETL